MQYQEIGQNVKAHRAKRDLTQRELAKLADISTSTVCDIERGIKPPSMKVLKRLSTALKCTMSDLVKED